LDNFCALLKDEKSGLARPHQNAHRVSEKLASLPHEAAKPQAQETFLDIDLEDLAFVFGLCMPKHIVLHQNEHRGADSSGAKRRETHDLRQG
jgi:hypothetical protein